MRLEAEAGFGRVNRIKTYERRLSTLVLASRNLANFNVQSEQCNDRCPGGVIIHIPKRASKVVTAKIVPCHDRTFVYCGIGLSYRRGLCSLFVQLYRAMREPLDDERQREVHAFFCVDMQKNDKTGLLLAISLPKRLKR